jgi:lysosomal acid lipase/cholesteryl ester hydrolase/gastric triacylglycerol lipase
MGTSDLKTAFDYITELTKYPKLAYVGHSQGTTQMFYGLTQMEDYFAEKVSVFVAMGPVAKIPHSMKMMTLGADHAYDLLERASAKFGIYAMGSDKEQSFWKKEAQYKFCEMTGELCIKVMDFFQSSDPEYDDPERYYVQTAHPGGSTPMKSLLHYAQNIHMDRFQVWGPHYGRLIKPKRQTTEIPISTITKVPIAIFAGKNDKIADAVDARWIRDTLTPATMVHY